MAEPCPTCGHVSAPEMTCSFCGKHQREVKKLIAGPKVYICDECIALCRDIIEEEDIEDLPDEEDDL